MKHQNHMFFCRDNTRRDVVRQFAIYRFLGRRDLSRPYRNLIIGLLLGGLMLMVGSLAAHGYIERTNPADGAELDQSPEIIQVWFSEPLIPDSGQISLLRGDGLSIQPESVYHAADDETLIIAELPPDLLQGAYIVTASAIVVSDGHEPIGSFVFWIGARDVIASLQSENKARPAYHMLGFFAGIFALLGAVGWFWGRADNRAMPINSLPIPPNDASPDHFKLP